MNSYDKSQSVFGYEPQQRRLPNATAVLVLGILSLVLAACYGVPGLTCGIIALVLSAKDHRRYRVAPYIYERSSYDNLKAGRVCAIIGVCLSAPFMLILLTYLTFLGTFFSAVFFHR